MCMFGCNSGQARCFKFFSTLQLLKNCPLHLLMQRMLHCTLQGQPSANATDKFFAFQEMHVQERNDQSASQWTEPDL